MKKIPYGLDNYEVIITQDYYYIDKTKYIRTVEEQCNFVLFVRPRRMGKSLFTNMLMAYYDINKRDQFNTQPNLRAINLKHLKKTKPFLRRFMMPAPNFSNTSRIII